MKCVTMITTNATIPLSSTKLSMAQKKKNEARDCSINICAIDCKGGVGVVINKDWRGMKTDSIKPPARSPPFGLPHVIKPSPTRMGPTMHLPQTSGGQMRVDLSG